MNDTELQDLIERDIAHLVHPQYLQGDQRKAVVIEKGEGAVLTDVRGLTGVWAPAGASPVTFALLDNDPDAETRAPGLWDRLGRALALYPAAVDLTPFRPLPPTTP